MHQGYPSDPDQYFVHVLEQIISSESKENYLKKVQYLIEKEKLNSLPKKPEIYQLIEDDPNFEAISNYVELYISASYAKSEDDLDDINLKMIDFWEHSEENIFDVDTENLLTPVFFSATTNCSLFFTQFPYRCL